MNFEDILSDLEVFEVLVEGFNFQNYNFKVKKCLHCRVSKRFYAWMFRNRVSIDVSRVKYTFESSTLGSSRLLVEWDLLSSIRETPLCDKEICSSYLSTL